MDIDVDIPFPNEISNDQPKRALEAAAARFQSCALPPTLSQGRRMKCFCRPCSMEVCLCEGGCFPSHFGSFWIDLGRCYGDKMILETDLNFLDIVVALSLLVSNLGQQFVLLCSECKFGNEVLNLWDRCWERGVSVCVCVCVCVCERLRVYVSVCVLSRTGECLGTRSSICSIDVAPLCGL